jgi:hypothetical protein
VASWLSQVLGFDPALGLAEDPEFYEKVLRDSAVASALDHLQKLVVGSDFYHQPRGDTREDRVLAKVLDELQQETEDFPTSLYNLAAASWKGATWAELRLARRILRIGDGKPRVWTVIREAKDVDKRRFRLTRAAATPITENLSRAPGGSPRLLDAAGSPYKGPLTTKWRWEFNRGYGSANSTSAWYAPLTDVAPLDQWCLHRVDTSERGLGYGYGLAEDLYFGIYAKGAVVKNLLQAIDRFGQGFLIQKVPGLRMGGPGGMTPEQKIQAVVGTLRKYRSQNVYACDADDEIQVEGVPGESIDACMRVISYFDDMHTMRILASTRSMGGKEGGAFAQAKVEEGSSDANVAFLRSPLEERWTNTGTRLLVKKNAGNLAELGIPTFLSTPRLRLRGRKMLDPEKAAVALDMAIKLRLPLVKREVYDLLEFSQPNPEDDPNEVLQTGELQALLEQRPEVASRVNGASDRAIEAAKNTGERAAVGEGGGSVAQEGGESRALARLAAMRG